MNNVRLAFLLAALTLFAFASPALAAAPCESLATLKLPDMTITLAQSIAAGGLVPPSAPGGRGGGPSILRGD